MMEINAWYKDSKNKGTELQIIFVNNRFLEIYKI